VVGEEHRSAHHQYLIWLKASSGTGVPSEMMSSIEVSWTNDPIQSEILFFWYCKTQAQNESFIKCWND